MTNTPSQAVQGTQVVRRVAALLRIVGRKPEGISIAGLVRESVLTRPTVHRLLASLAAEGLLDRDAHTGNWILGPEVFLLGAVAASRFPFEDIARPSLRRRAAALAWCGSCRGARAICSRRRPRRRPCAGTSSASLRSP